MNVGTLLSVLNSMIFPLTHLVTLNEQGMEVSSPESCHPPDNFPHPQ